MRVFALASLFLIAPVVSTLSGCRIFGAELPCELAEDCAPGASCVDSVCVAVSAAGEGEGEGEGEGGEGEGEACLVPSLDGALCGGPGALRDTFDADTARWLTDGDDGDDIATIGGGIAHLQGDQVELSSHDRVLVRGGSISTNVVALDSNPLITSMFVLRFNRLFSNTNSVRFEANNGQIVGVVEARDVAPVFTTPYVLAGETFWRFREDGGQMHFELSSDGVSYADLGETLALPPEFDAAFIAYQLQAADLLTDGTFDVASVNDDATPVEFCPLAGFTDAFCDTALKPTFRAAIDEPTACSVGEGDDVVTMTLSSFVGDAECVAESTLPMLGTTPFSVMYEVDFTGILGANGIVGDTVTGVSITGSLRGFGLVLRKDAISGLDARLCGEIDSDFDSVGDNVSLVDLLPAELPSFVRLTVEDALFRCEGFAADGVTLLFSQEVVISAADLEEITPGHLAFGVATPENANVAETATFLVGDVTVQ